jgi:hypothetical protein
MVKRGVANTAAATMDLKSSSNSRRSKRSNAGKAIAAATAEGTADPIAEPKDSKRSKNAAVATNIGPVQKRSKVKLQKDIRPDVPDPVAALPDPPANLEPVPDPATSLSNLAAMSTEGRAIVHVEHRTGNVLCTYKSCFAAAKSVGISRHIVDSLVKGVYKANHHKGATFRYATNEEQAAFSPTEANRNNIEQIDVASGKVMATFPSVLAASNETGVGRKDISSMLKGKLESKNGWTFQYPILPDIVKSEPADTPEEENTQMNEAGTQNIKDDTQEVVADAKTRVSSRIKTKDAEPGISTAPEQVPVAKKAPNSDKLDSKVKPAKISKASKKDTTGKKLKAHLGSDKDDESTEYEVHEITVTEHGSMGIMARKTKAPKAVLSLVHLFDGYSEGDMHLCIDSFIGEDSIAEKFGMRVGDVLFVEAGCYGRDGLHIFGEYKSVAFYIRRNARPTVFFVVRSKLSVVASNTSKGRKSSFVTLEDDSLEDMDPMKDLEKNTSDYIFQPIVITEPGPLGIKVVKCDSQPEGFDRIPYFCDIDEDPYSDYSLEYGLKVESLIGEHPLALKFGIQAGDFLVLPSSEYKPAMYNYQEAFYVDTYEGVCDVIKNGDRPITLYAIRLKSGGSTVDINEVASIEVAVDDEKENDDNDDGEDDNNDDDSEGSYHCSGFEGWMKTQKRVVAMAKDFLNWKEGNSSSYDHKRHLKRCQRGIDEFLKVYLPGWPNVDRWEFHLAKISKEYKELTKARKEVDTYIYTENLIGRYGRYDYKKEGKLYDEEIIGHFSDSDYDHDDEDDEEDDDEEDEKEYVGNDDEDNNYDELWGAEDAWQFVEDKVIAMENEFWQWRKGKNPSYNHKRHLKLCNDACDRHGNNPSGSEDAELWYLRLRRMNKVYKKLTKAPKTL